MTLEDDRGSLATINSDEEPLEGDTSEHVEAMLRACLDPDERQLSDDDDDDHVVDPLLYKSSQIEAAAELDLKSLADSELDELDELTLAHEHAQALADALDEFSVHADHALSDAHAPPPPPPPPPAAAAPPLASVPARVRELRELQRELRQLALNDRALNAHYTQQLLGVARAQADLCASTHDASQQRHRQLRIVRRECARLCGELEALHRNLLAPPRTPRSPTARRKLVDAARRSFPPMHAAAASAGSGASRAPAELSALVELACDRAVRELAAPPAPAPPTRAASPPRRRPRPSGLEAAYAPTPRTRRTNETSRASTERGGAADLPTAPPADGGGPWQVLRLPAVQAALADQLWTLLSRRVPGHETHR